MTSSILSTLVVLFLLQCKHWYVDFHLQTNEQIRLKGVYGDPVGISHSLQHLVATGVIVGMMWAILPHLTLVTLCGLALIDGVVHYHVDYCKSRFGANDIRTKAFWTQLGLDQLAHQATYLLIAGLVVLAGS